MPLLFPVTVDVCSRLAWFDQELVPQIGVTVSQLRAENHQFELTIPVIRQRLATANHQIALFAPSVSEQRTSVKEIVATLQQVEELRERKIELEKSPEQLDDASSESATDLSATILHNFCTVIQGILASWHFPGGDSIYFDQKKRDIVISGKPRASRGKGMRAITHAAFTLALVEYCRANNKPHPGFVILDSPLLAYREPEPGDDAISRANLREHFFASLQGWSDRQVIVIENVDPPGAVADAPYTTFFNSSLQGRYGFFPVSS